MTVKRFDLANAPLDEGTVLLEASAGTGKTYTLVGILLRLLVERRIERMDQALVVTFTVAATEELKNRLRDGLVRTLRAVRHGDTDPFFAGLARTPGAEPLLRQALDDFDQVGIATIHGFCKRLLDEAAFESHEPFHLDFATDPLPLLYRAAADVLRGCYTDEVSLASAVLHGGKLAPEQLVEWYRLWHRYPDVRLLPERPDPDALLHALQPLVAAAAAIGDEDVLLQLAGLPWYAGKSPFPTPPQPYVNRLLGRLQSCPALVLGELCRFARASLAKTVQQEGRHSFGHRFFDACDAVLSTRDATFEHLRAQLLHRMHVRLDGDKRRDHVLSFDDLLVRTHAALHDPARAEPLLAAIRARYTVALIDEFQDTDAVQYGIFAKCFANRPLFLIGDPKQSIYGFRGADLQAYVAAGRDAVRKATLDTNFRSADGLVRAVSLLFGKPDAFVDPGIQMPAVHAAAPVGELQLHGDPGAPLRWRFVPPAGGKLLGKDDAEDRIALDVAAEISRLLRAGITLDGTALRAGHIAVLTRTNRQALAVQDQLRRAGIVSAIGKAGDIFETDELVELERLLQAILQPGDLLAARAAMATRLWGRTAAELDALRDDEPGFDHELARLVDWRALWIRSGFVVMKEQLLADLGATARLLAQRGGERRLTNFQQLFELLHDAEHGGRLTPEGLLEWLQHERAHHEEIDYQVRELRLESDEDAVQILTAHGSKGLQYEVVFCPFLWDARPPGKTSVVPGTAGRQLAFDLRDQDPEWFAADEERLAEDVRLCYVAMTRAKRRCYVHWAATGPGATGSWRSALAWLLEPQSPPREVGNTPNPKWLDDWARARKKDLPGFRLHLHAFVAAAEGTMDVLEVPDKPRPAPCTPPPLPALRPALRPARLVRARALHSFSSLTAGATPGAEGRDVADRAAPSVELPASAPPAGIFAFARGAAAGTCLHSILEHTDLRNIDDATEHLVRDTLAGSALDHATAHPAGLDPVSAVLQNLRDLAGSLVHTAGPTLAQLCGGPRLAEWQFLLPTQHSEVFQLAQAFAASSSEVAREHAGRIHQLPARTLRGFLTGFVDLVCEHDGRYWVIDWKSNHLGNQPADYGPAALQKAMHEHDYVLQYHLYVLALHRHLRARIADYDYDRCVGGVCYVFLRGAVPGTENGMFHDRVPRQLVLAMDRWAFGLAGGTS